MGRKARIRAARRTTAQQRGRAEALLLPSEVRDQYSGALATLFARVADQPSSGDPATEWLQALASFYQDHIRWAVLKPDGQVESLEGGARVLGWFVAISPDHPRARQQRQVLQTDWMNSHYGLFVRPERVTHEWAALLAIHELEHIASMVSGREARSQGREPYLAGEVRAYSVEGAAADVVSGGRYLAAVEKAIDDGRLASSVAIASLNGTRSLDEISRKLDRVISPHAPASAGEARLRGGLHMMALGFIRINREVANWEGRFEQRKRFIERLYEPLGVLPPH